LGDRVIKSSTKPNKKLRKLILIVNLYQKSITIDDSSLEEVKAKAD
jgi:hypothetical protein